jgi:predicted ATPase
LWLGVTDARKRSSLGERTKGRRGGFIIPGGGITVVIEQPELHLHPRMQARFADLLISIASVSTGENYDVRIICETHSEVIINRVGNRIAEGFTSQNVAKVYLFEKMENECVDVSLATFDENGVLLNWPFGFFQP